MQKADSLICCCSKAVKATLKDLKITGYFISPQGWSCSSVFMLNYYIIQVASYLLLPQVVFFQYQCVSSTSNILCKIKSNFL